MSPQPCRQCKRLTDRGSRICNGCRVKNRKHWAINLGHQLGTVDLLTKAMSNLSETDKEVVIRWWSRQTDYLVDVEVSYESIRTRARKYKLTMGDWMMMVAKQRSMCTICRTTQHPLKLNIDHCHVTGFVRGLLCTSCNTGLGLLGIDGHEAVRRAEAVLAFARKNARTIVPRQSAS